MVGDAAEDNVFAFLRYDAEGSPLLSVSNLSPVVRHDYRLGAPDDVPAWHEVLNTDAAGYGGSGVAHPDPVKPEPQGHHGRAGERPADAAAARDAVAATCLSPAPGQRPGYESVGRCPARGRAVR